MIDTGSNEYIKSLSPQETDNTKKVYVQPYISYKINKKTIKSLNLDNPKL